MRIVISALCVALTAMTARKASAQQSALVSGAVVNGRTRLGIPDASVFIQLSADTARLTMRTDSAGRFHFARRSGDVVSIAVQKIGFEPSTVFPDPAWTGDTVTIALNSIAALGPVTVTAMSNADRRLAANGFYDRKKVGFGTFLDSAYVSHHLLSSTVNMLRGHLRGCTMIFVDGVAMLSLRDVDPRTIIGIEIYASNTEAPARFWNRGETGSRCGSIVVWRQGD